MFDRRAAASTAHLAPTSFRHDVIARTLLAVFNPTVKETVRCLFERIQHVYFAPPALSLSHDTDSINRYIVSLCESLPGCLQKSSSLIMLLPPPPPGLQRKDEKMLRDKDVRILIFPSRRQRRSQRSSKVDVPHACHTTSCPIVSSQKSVRSKGAAIRAIAGPSISSCSMRTC